MRFDLRSWPRLALPCLAALAGCGGQLAQHPATGHVYQGIDGVRATFVLDTTGGVNVWRIDTPEGAFYLVNGQAVTPLVQRKWD